MNGPAFGRFLLFAFGILAPLAWGALTFLELPQRAVEAALALTVVGAAVGLLLQWAWLSRMTALLERMERRIERPSPYVAPPAAGGAAAASPASAPRAQPASPAVGKAAAPAAKTATPSARTGPAAASSPPSARPAGHEEAYASYDRGQNAPPPLPPPPAAAAESHYPYGYAESGAQGRWEAPAAEPPPFAGGRRLDGMLLAAAWNELLAKGVFDAKSLAATIDRSVEVEIKPPDNFVGLGLPLLVALEPGQRERAFLLPDFTRPPKVFDKWFELDPQMASRISRLSRPAELKRAGNGYELAVKGRLE